MGDVRAKEASRALKRLSTGLPTNSGTSRTVMVENRTCDTVTESTVTDWRIGRLRLT